VDALTPLAWGTETFRSLHGLIDSARAARYLQGSTVARKPKQKNQGQRNKNERAHFFAREISAFGSVAWHRATPQSRKVFASLTHGAIDCQGSRLPPFGLISPEQPALPSKACRMAGPYPWRFAEDEGGYD
jgi:hypothetical protein